MKNILPRLEITYLFIVIFSFAIFNVFASTPAPPSQNGMVNLVQGKKYTVTPLVPINYSFGPNEVNYYSPGALTDGQIGSSTQFNDGQWQGYSHGGSRSIIIDMGQVNTVNQIQERFLHYPSAGIYFPREVTFALSLNDSDWANVGSVNSAMPLTTDTVATQTYIASGLNYQARYVKMVFTVDVWVFADEFQVFGNLGVINNATVPKITPPISYPNAYCPPASPEVGGTKNMVLIYNGYSPSNPSLGQNTVGELTPYVGYKSPSGTISDFMFDGFLFLPNGTGPSGGAYGINVAQPSVMSDWVYYLNNSFDSLYNLGALDSATGNVKKLLNNSSYKAKVEIAIPFPNPSATNFGDVDGDGISENLTYLAEREKVVKWYIDQVITKWNHANYSNLELVGFYWYSESAGFNVDDSETTLLGYIANYIAGQGKVFNWIPFLDASGFAEWNLLGFDGAWMQPNYAFSSYPEQELGEAADAIKKLGMGIEIEIHWNALTVDSLRSKYYAYLNYGVTKGYMKGAAHTYYQNSGPGTFYQSCISTDPVNRAIYDKTYNFIKGTYEPTPTGIKPLKELPGQYSLSQNYPNPFNPSTTITVSLIKSGLVSLRIFNALGQLVKLVDQSYKMPGVYTYDLNMDNLSSGVYFYTLTQGYQQITKKMILLK